MSNITTRGENDGSSMDASAKDRENRFYKSGKRYVIGKKAKQQRGKK